MDQTGRQNKNKNTWIKTGSGDVYQAVQFWLQKTRDLNNRFLTPTCLSLTFHVVPFYQIEPRPISFGINHVYVLNAY